MKPYTLILVKKDLSKQKFFYSELSSDAKRDLLKQEITKNNGHLYCNCLYPNSKLELQITADNKIAPKGHNYIHADSCPKSELSKQCAKYNSAFQRMEENENNIIANVSLDFSAQKRRTESSKEYHTYKEPTETTRKMTVSALIKKLNMITFQDIAFSKKATEYPTIEESCRWINWKTKFIYISKDKTLKDLSIENDNKKFFYGIFHNERRTSKTFSQLIVTEYFSKKNTITEQYEAGSHDLKMSLKTENYDLALSEFKKTYNGMTLYAAIENEYNIICSGFYTRNAKGFNTCLDCHFILVNKNGLFSESKYEAAMYDYVFSYLNKNDLKSKYAFYKPWEFGTSIYKNNYLEDGVFYNKSTDEEYYLEVFGMNTPSYIATKAHKESIAADRLISWNAINNDPKPDLKTILA